MFTSLSERTLRLGRRAPFAQLGVTVEKRIACPRQAPAAHRDVIPAGVADTCRESVRRRIAVVGDPASAMSRQGSPSTCRP